MVVSEMADVMDPLQPIPVPHVMPHPNEDPRRILLVMDVQKFMLSPPPLGVPASGVVGTNISKILAQARNASHPPRIIFVRNHGDRGEPDEPNTIGWQLVHDPLPREYVIDKRKNNAFAGTALAELIPADAEIVMIGMQSDFCIRATCSSALERGNDVLLIKLAHATFDRLEVWGSGAVTPAAQVEKEIESELEEAGVILLEMKDLPSIFDNR